MANWFGKERNTELSLIYYIENQISNDWSGINVVKSFNQATKESLPVIAIYLSDIDSYRKEIATTTLRNECMIAIDIFAKHDGQRLDLTSSILGYIKEGWTYYKHGHPSGDNSSLSREADGKVQLLNIVSNTRVDIGRNVEEHDKYRQSMLFVAEKI